jgi:nitrile hydratase accessory protein
VDQVRDAIDTLDGRAAPPRKNGELVFDAPWESRAFGMAVALYEQGAYRWEEFSARLAIEIVADAGNGPPNEAVLPVAPEAEAAYYGRWLEALQTLLIEKGLLLTEELDARTAEVAAGIWDHQP